MSENGSTSENAAAEKRRKLLDHAFAFFIEYDCGVEDAFRFYLDGKEADVIGLGYAGPRKEDFVQTVSNLKERNLLEVGYLYEPGEANILFSRRKENVYAELPHMGDGFS